MCAFSRTFDQLRSLERFGVQIRDAGLEFFCEFVAPALEDIGPSFNRVLISSDLVKRTNSAPAIVVDKTHRGLVPVWFTDEPPFQGRRYNVVPIFENIGFNREIVTRDPLDWIAPAVDQWA